MRMAHLLPVWWLTHNRKSGSLRPDRWLKYSKIIQRLEVACEKALTYTATPSYKSVKNLLTTAQDKTFPNEKPSENTHNRYGITRGAGYYGR